ncbi:hypothetical protein [Nocardioides sp. P86]|uniref:hypothetical protein n=1 Tax=Nocardioides sp. P86 TaxID=2939569 RepID=UPI00203E6131|nr:hypothetical protein [Nocardioides sp. P86]MCM3515020.1 hypothetical protein [Nocardioides sp. P86]
MSPGPVAPHPAPDVRRPPASGPGRTWPLVVAMAAAATLGWLPFVGRDVGPDEGGLLLVAAQWAPGSSVYGDYFVDRPPVLLALVAAAEHLGGLVGLRLLGALAVVACVLLAGLVGRLAAPGTRRGPLMAAGAAAALTATPLFGGTVVDAEILGVPFLLAGTAATLAALTAPDARRAALRGALAGAAAVAAALTKQNLVDVGVLLAALAVTGLLARRGAARLRPLLAGAVAGGLAALVLALVGAATRGTGPVELWRAVVTFRSQAGRVIATADPPSSADRFVVMLVALLASGAPLLLAALAPSLRRAVLLGPDRLDLRWAAAAVLAWECVGVALGGSYWLHYLTGLVPGIVLVAALAARTPPRSPGWRRRALVTAYAGTALSAAVAVGWVGVHPIERSELAVSAWLVDHGRPGDTAVVAFGEPNVLWAAGMSSPYEQLWSLPVRVSDPDLRELAAVLEGPRRPTWLVVAGRSLLTWGVDPDAAEPAVAAHYREVAVVAGYTVLEVRR